MRLVIDTNIAFSLLKKGSFTRQLAKKHALELYSHHLILRELDKYSEILCSKLKVSKDKFDRIKVVLSRLVNLKKKVSLQQLNRARSLLSDPKDAPYLALAVKLGIDIWSNDPHLKEQSVVRVFRTDELSDFLEDSSSTFA
jgi:predicted nucleic acid-binding protein